MAFDVPDCPRMRTQRLPPRRGQIKVAIFKKLVDLASLAVSGIARRGGGRPGHGPVEARRRDRAPGWRRVHHVPDSGGWMRTQRLSRRRGQIKIAIFKKLLDLASLAVSGIARRGGGRPGDGPVGARGRGRVPGRRRVHQVPDSGGPMPM